MMHRDSVYGFEHCSHCSIHAPFQIDFTGILMYGKEVKNKYPFPSLLSFLLSLTTFGAVSATGLSLYLSKSLVSRVSLDSGKLQHPEYHINQPFCAKLALLVNSRINKLIKLVCCKYYTSYCCQRGYNLHNLVFQIVSN